MKTKSTIKLIGLFLFTALFMVACDSYPSLQKYYVDSKENNEFISVDLPASIIQLKDTEVSDDIKQTLETIKKVNFLALQITDENQELFEAEKVKVKAILKNPQFKQVARMNMNGSNLSMSYIGEENAIDEVVIYGADKTQGFALVRVLGENMNPADILKLTQEIKIDGDSPEMKQLGSIFKNISK